MMGWYRPERLGETGDETGDETAMNQLADMTGPAKKNNCPTKGEVNKAIMNKFAAEDVLNSALDNNNAERNHDTHYSKKMIEPILVIEETIDRLITSGVTPKSALNICQSLKYTLRAGLKEDENPHKEIDKALNYLYRAKHGEWI